MISSWSNNPEITTHWEGATDDCTVEYRVLWDHSSGSIPDSLAQAVTDLELISEPLPDGDDHWFHVLAKDVPGNLAINPQHLGPFWIDSTPPEIQVIYPVGGQYLASGTLVTIAWTAEDPSSGPGPSEIHYTIDAGASWNPIATFTDPMINTCDWTVPEAVTDSARVRVTVTDLVGNSGQATNERWLSIGPPTGVGWPDDGPPSSEFHLAGNYPNPFNPSTTIRFSVPARAQVRLIVFDLLGREVRTLQDGTLDGPAWYEIPWDGANEDGLRMPTGIYFYRLESGDFRGTKKMTLLK